MLGRAGATGTKEGGSAAVEFAVVLPLLLFVLAGIVGLGRILWYYDALAKATRDGARVMSMADLSDAGKRSAALAAAQSRVKLAADAAGLPPVLPANVRVLCDATACSTAAPASVSVEIIDYSVDLGALFPFVPVGDAGWTIESLSLKPKTTMPYLH